MLCSYSSESIVRALIPLHSMQAKLLDQGFPNGVDWWGAIWVKWPKTACKLQNLHFWIKTVGEGGKQIFWIVEGA